jgi:hypothetical protein
MPDLGESTRNNLGLQLPESIPVALNRLTTTHGHHLRDLFGIND